MLIQKALKYGLDLLIAVVLTLLLSPLFVLIAVAIVVVDGKPVIFRQKRIGLDEKSFTLYKLRTLSVPSKESATDQRVTRTGRFLRGTSLDELPQLINVLRGEMSLVGPRPLLERYLPYYTEKERLRHTVRPGITGWAQVHGRNLLPWDERLALDVWYVDNWSLRLDLRVLMLTLQNAFDRGDSGVVLRPETSMRDLDEERPKSKINV